MTSNTLTRLIKNGYIKSEETGNPLAVLLRILVIPLVYIGGRLGIHPNSVTALSITLGCLAAVFFLRGDLGLYAFAWVAAVLLDYVDGGIARRTQTESHVGYLIDTLGDRVKLIALIIAWSIVHGGTLASSLTVAMVSVLAVTEILSHLLVRHKQRIPWIGWSWRRAPYRVFGDFNMHSFLIYGLAILPGGDLSLWSNIWLLLVLLFSSGQTFAARIVKDGAICIHVNHSLLTRISRDRQS